MKFLQKLIDSFRKLPGVGPKQAERFANYILKCHGSEIDELISAISEVRNSVRLCVKCNNYTLNELCDICMQPDRDNKICIVETPFDIVSIEKTHVYNGRYFVIGRHVIPSEQTGEFISKLEKLKKIILSDKINEVIIALDTTTEGQVTSLYIKRFLKDLPVKVSRIAYGVPLGADIDYMDEYTLSYALKGRVLIEEE